MYGFCASINYSVYHIDCASACHINNSLVLLLRSGVLNSGSGANVEMKTQVAHLGISLDSLGLCMDWMVNGNV